MPQTLHLTPLPKSATTKVSAGCELVAPAYVRTQSQLSPTLRQDLRGAKKPARGGRIPISYLYFE